MAQRTKKCPLFGSLSHVRHSYCFIHKYCIVAAVYPPDLPLVVRDWFSSTSAVVELLLLSSMVYSTQYNQIKFNELNLRHFFSLLLPFFLLVFHLCASVLSRFFLSHSRISYVVKVFILLFLGIYSY